MRVYHMMVSVLTLFTLNKAQIDLSASLEYRPFPIDEFYNTSRTDRSIPLDYFGWQCQGPRTTIYKFIVQPCCDCDGSCWKYATCCIDILWDSHKPMKLEKYLEKFKNKLNQYRQTTCEKVLPNAQDDYEIESLYMISTCLPTADKQSVELCRNASIMGAKGSIPVLGNDTYLYLNEYCAKCNNIIVYEHHSLEVKCVDARNVINGKKLSLPELYKQKECIITMKRTNENKAFLKKCQKQELSGDCSKEEKELCRIHQGKISKGYKNYFCLKCSSQFKRYELLPLQCPKECGKQKLCYIADDRDLSKYSYRFEITPIGFDFQVTNFHQTFPIWDFLELPSSFKLSKEEGFEQYLCSGRRNKCCECSNNCFIKKKCCADILWNQTNPVDLIIYKELLVEERDKVKDQLCLPVYPPAVGTRYGVANRILIRSCKRKANNLDRKNCLSPIISESPSVAVPVLGSDGLLYTNSFCAKCNFVDYTYVNLTLKCKTVTFKESDFSGNTTNGTFNFDIRSRTHSCLVDVDKAFSYSSQLCPSPVLSPLPFCIDYNDPSYYLCKSYYGVIDNYPNFHCRSCNKKDRITKSMINYCDPSRECLYRERCETVVQPTAIPWHPRFRWTLTLSFTDDTANLNFNDDHRTLQSRCTGGQYFEIKLGKCVTIHCPPRYKRSGLDCFLDQELDPRQTGYSSNFQQNLNIMDKDYFVYLQFDNEKINQTAFSVSNQTYKIFYTVNNQTIFISEKVVNITTNDKIVKTLQSHFKTHAFHGFIGLKIDPLLIINDYGLDFSRFFHGDRLCAMPIKLPYRTIGANATTFTYQNKTINITNITYWMSFQNIEMSHHYSLCSQFHLVQPCARRLLLHNEITKADNMTITYNISKGVQVKYEAADYIPTNDGYYICLNKTNILLKSKKTMNQHIENLLDVEYYITIVGTSISIACYLCIILTYIIFEDLRTISGLNNCFMCLSLLIADVMALSSLKANENYTSCFTVAIIMHWSLLAAFSWTSIVAFDLVSRFGTFILHSNENKASKMARRAVFGFLLPTVIVAIAVALDQSGTLEFGYGDHQICWRINNLYPRIGFYIVPTALVTLIALASLFYTVGKISKEKKSTEKYLGSTGDSKFPYIKMAIKLCVILGITELFGYIQIPDPNESEQDFNVAVGFIYAVLRSFRGVMLWFVYVYGGSIRNRYKKQFKRSIRRKRYGWSSENLSDSPMTLYKNSKTSLSTPIKTFTSSGI